MLARRTVHVVFYDAHSSRNFYSYLNILLAILALCVFIGENHAIYPTLTYFTEKKVFDEFCDILLSSSPDCTRSYSYPFHHKLCMWNNLVTLVNESVITYDEKDSLYTILLMNKATSVIIIFVCHNDGL